MCVPNRDFGDKKIINGQDENTFGGPGGVKWPLRVVLCIFFELVSEHWIMEYEQSILYLGHICEVSQPILLSWRSKKVSSKYIENIDHFSRFLLIFPIRWQKFQLFSTILVACRTLRSQKCIENRASSLI